MKFLLFIFKLIGSILLSAITYAYILSGLHVAFYLWRRNMGRQEIAVGDGFFLFCESVLIICIQTITVFVVPAFVKHQRMQK